jgi:hypothetical protein
MPRTLLAALGAVAALLAVTPLASAATNVLANPGFESFYDGGGPKPTDWTVFNNTYSEAMPFAHAGARVEKFFGNWSGPWNAAGVIQTFASAPGDLWELDCFAYNWSGDPLVADADPSLNNRLIMKIEFQDAASTPIGSNEAVIVDPYTPQDVWIDPPAVQAVAPAGTAKALAVFVFLQPNWAGGSAWIDDASFVLVPEPGSLALIAGGALLLWRRRR